MKECRICYENHSYFYNRLVSPCSCKGTIGYVHEYCIARCYGETCKICRQPIQQSFWYSLMPILLQYIIGTFFFSFNFFFSMKFYEFFSYHKRKELFLYMNYYEIWHLLFSYIIIFYYFRYDTIFQKYCYFIISLKLEISIFFIYFKEIPQIIVFYSIYKILDFCFCCSGIYRLVGL